MSYLRWQSAVDFIVLSTAFYFLLLWARKTRALRLAFAIVLLHAGALVARRLELIITGWVFDGVSIGALVLLVILFQGEIRLALLRLDDVLRLGILPRQTSPQVFRALAEAAFSLGSRRIGALIVLPRENSIAEMVKGGIRYGAQVSKPVLESVFDKHSPLHDGAAVVEEKIISQVSAVLPLTEREAVPMEYGTRHRAGMGLAERCDALVIVVSEERGTVTLMYDRKVEEMADAASLIARLERLNSTKTATPGQRLRSLLLTNLKYRIAAAGLAAAIWSASMLGSRTTIKTVSVPVEFQNLPRGMEISRQSPLRVEVQLRGSPWIMDTLSGSGIVARLDLSGATEGARQLRISPSRLNVPPGVVVEQVFPEAINVTVASKTK